MSTEITRIIDQFLQGELSEQDRLAFEKRMAESEVLRREVVLQKAVYEGAERAALRTQVKQASKAYHVLKRLKTGSLILLIAAALTIVALAVGHYFKASKKVSEAMIALMEKVRDHGPVDNLRSEFFVWNGDDSVMISSGGVLLSIPQQVFLLDGKPYNGETLIQWQEALDAASIVKNGLSTMSGDRLLETQGMFGFQAYAADGRKLEVDPEKGIYVQVPVDEYKQGMQLFEGKANQAGIIDWQHPRPLMKIPVPVDMGLLDFYPPHYEDTLDHLRLRKDKKYRDSLYLSFSPSVISPNKLESGRRLFLSKCATCHQLDKNATGPALSGVRSKWFAHAKDPASVYGFVQNWEDECMRENYAREVVMQKPTAMIFFPDLSSDLINDIFEYADHQTGHILSRTDRNTVNAMLTDTLPARYGLDPAKVMAFWNPSFNNTNLSTREFERRMRIIHSFCEDELLDIYTRNLSSPLYELDARVAKMGVPGFADFAAEQVGALNPDSPHTKNLRNFYEKTVRLLQQEVAGNREALIRKQQQWDRAMLEERLKEQKRTTVREQVALMEEFSFNMQAAHKQLGKTVGFQIHGTGSIYNIDKYVMDATVARRSADITDPETGETATVRYNDFSFEVVDAAAYGKLFAYLFPSKLNSFQRIASDNGGFSYPLNDGMIYDLAIVGISAKGYAYFQQKTLKGGNLGKIDLQNISESKLNASIEQLNNGRMGNPTRITEELYWLVREQKDYREQQLRQERQAFTDRISRTVFPCAVLLEWETYDRTRITK